MGHTSKPQSIDRNRRCDFESLFELERKDLLYDGLARVYVFAAEIAEAANKGPEGALEREHADQASPKWAPVALEVRRALERLRRTIGLCENANGDHGHPGTTRPPREHTAREIDKIHDLAIDSQFLRRLIEPLFKAIQASPPRLNGTHSSDPVTANWGLPQSCHAEARLAPLIHDVAEDFESFQQNRDRTCAQTVGIVDLDIIRSRRDSAGRTVGAPTEKIPVAASVSATESAGEGAPGTEARPASAPPRAAVDSEQPLSEPYVSFLGPDLVGLALSGGGIRSATFNLGLLQGLHSFRVLDLVDYLSTVSGGGYIGGWWSAWRKNSLEAGPRHVFPDRLVPETPLVRHLREFSNFLAPRASLFSVELWYGLISIIGGLLPTLILAALQIFVVVLGWSLLAAGCLYGTRNIQVSTWSFGASEGVVAAAMFLGTLLIQYALESQGKRPSHIVAKEKGQRESRSRNAESNRRAQGNRDADGTDYYWLSALIGAVVSVPALIIASMILLNLDERSSVAHSVPGIVARLVRSYQKWDGPEWVLLAPAVAWLAAGSCILLVRGVSGRIVEARLQWSKSTDQEHIRSHLLTVHAAISRSVSRLFVPALVWIVFWCLWELALWFLLSSQSLIAVGGAAALGSEVFRRLRHWISFRPSEAQSGNFVDRIRPYIPQLLAYGILTCLIILAAAGVAALLQRVNVIYPVPILLVVSLLALGTIAFSIDPHAFGLHEYYRGRIARTYLGASNRSEDLLPDNRTTFEHPQDDFLFGDFKQLNLRRPIHLVCCAANDLAGDVIEGLGRGARSATITRFGVSIANAHSEKNRLTFGAALTASAAAFNPQMGSLSGEYGPAVAFLLTALNLRLGRWIEHPAWNRNPPSHQASERIPGKLIFREFLSQSCAGLDEQQSALQQFVHLSDGGHFENLGLYELVRRHCRYIIVSDCGADPEFACDDIGNALRRIREDFGVEIEIDVSVLKPAVPGGCAAQHVAVGTIHYDDQFDKGVLLVFKPNLTGDEPDDVKQYRTRNEAFPQETTVDQFYDEAQWESYRRLGEHSARAALRFMERQSTRGVSRYQVFTDAFYQWYPTPPGLADRMLEYTERYSRFLSELRASAVPGLTEELFSELREGCGLSKQVVEQFNLTSVVPILLQMGQILEDAFVGLQLGATCANPLNAGWMSVYHRWTQSPLFRQIWPLVQPMFSREFRQFLNDRFRMGEHSPGDMDSVKLRDWIRLVPSDASPRGLALDAWFKRKNPSPFENDSIVYAFEMKVEIAQGRSETIQLAIAQLTFVFTADNRRLVRWNTDDIFLVPWLRGVNIATAFVETLLRRLSEDGATEIEVSFDGKYPTDRQSDSVGTRMLHRSDEAMRAFRADLVRLYKSLGFKLRKSKPDGRQFLVRTL